MKKWVLTPDNKLRKGKLQFKEVATNDVDLTGKEFNRRSVEIALNFNDSMVNVGTPTNSGMMYFIVNFRELIEIYNHTSLPISQNWKLELPENFKSYFTKIPDCIVFEKAPFQQIGDIKSIYEYQQRKFLSSRYGKHLKFVDKLTVKGKLVELSKNTALTTKFNRPPTTLEQYIDIIDSSFNSSKDGMTLPDGKIVLFDDNKTIFNSKEEYLYYKQLYRV